jgi:bifunctional DNA-binding transcriptional regulator/antitoxin component of YhaV-PrlF toxin-antitoxin module
LISVRTSHLVYGLAAVDDRGRIADRVVLRALGWSAGQRLTIAETGGMLTVHTDPAGDHQVTNQGHLRIPAPLRHRCGLTAGDRVLLAADPDESRLTIYPPAALDNALAQPGGEPQ